MTAGVPGVIGRESQLARLDQVVAAVAIGTSDFVLLVGEAGIGKTRLLRAAADAAEHRGIRTLRGTCMESGTALPYLPLLGPLAMCIAPPASGPAVDRVRKVLHRDGASGRRRPGAEQEDAALLVASIYDVLTARPTVLLIDDVQWADGSTLAVLDYISHRGADAAIGIVAAARDDEPGRLRQLPIADGRRYIPLGIPRLSRSEVGAQVAELLETGTSVADLDEIFRRTSGNPFFVEQLVAEWSAGSPPGRDAPPQLRALVLARVARLSSSARAAVEALAVLEHPASEALVAGVAALPVDAVSTSLREAISGGVAAAGASGYAMRHPVFGEAVRAELGGAIRGFHRRAAEALEAAAGDPGQIAEHWWQAGDAARAWRAGIDAGHAAIRALGFPEARLHLERALELWPAGEPGRATAELEAGQAAWVGGDAPGALEHSRLAEAHLRQTSAGSVDADADADGMLLDVLLAQGAAAWDAGARQEALRVFGRMEELISVGLPPAQQTRVLWGLGRARVGEGRTQEAHDLAIAAAALAREAGDRTQEAEDYALAGMSRAFQGSLEAVGLLRRARDLALEGGSPPTIGHAFQFLVDLLDLSGDVDGALAAALEGIEIAERLGMGRSHAADLRGRAALLLLELGRSVEAAALVRSTEPRALPEIALARLAMRSGDRAAAERAVTIAEAAGTIGGPGSMAEWTGLTRVELAFLFCERSAGQEELARMQRPPGIWGIDFAAWQAMWSVRLVESGQATAPRAERNTSSLGSGCAPPVERAPGETGDSSGPRDLRPRDRAWPRAARRGSRCMARCGRGLVSGSATARRLPDAAVRCRGKSRRRRPDGRSLGDAGCGGDGGADRGGPTGPYRRRPRSSIANLDVEHSAQAARSHRAHSPRGRCPAAAGGRPHEHPDRRSPVSQPQDGGHSRLPRPGEAGCPHARRSRGRRAASWAGRRDGLAGALTERVRDNPRHLRAFGPSAGQLGW